MFGLRVGAATAGNANAAAVQEEMRKKFLRFIALQYSVIQLFALLGFSVIAYGQTLTPAVECGYDRREHVASGIEYRERCFERHNDGPFTLQILEVDPANPRINLLPVRAGDRPTGKETVSSMARRYGATAAVNGGYFVVSGENAGASAGAYQFNRQVIAAGSKRSALLFCEEKNYREKLAIAIVSLSKQKTAPASASCDPLDVVGGGPRLVRSGKLDVPAEKFGHADKRHPRTAVAITKRGTFLFVTLDGRQPKSVGMRLDEFAAELIALGAVDALNLDGGGSTTMVVKNTIRNSPSDGRERPVSDGILIFSIGTLEELSVLVERLGADPLQISAEALALLREKIKAGDFEGVGKIAEGPGISVQAARLLREAAYFIKTHHAL